jgi:hypothetical protein
MFFLQEGFTYRNFLMDMIAVLAISAITSGGHVLQTVPFIIGISNS